MTDVAPSPSLKGIRPTQVTTGLIWMEIWQSDLREEMECERRGKGALSSLHVLKLGWGCGPDLGGASRTWESGWVKRRCSQCWEQDQEYQRLVCGLGIPQLVSRK